MPRAAAASGRDFGESPLAGETGGKCGLLYTVVDEQRPETQSALPTAEQVGAAAAGERTHAAEPHSDPASARLN